MRKLASLYALSAFSLRPFMVDLKVFDGTLLRYFRPPVYVQSQDDFWMPLLYADPEFLFQRGFRVMKDERNGVDRVLHLAIDQGGSDIEEIGTDRVLHCVEILSSRRDELLRDDASRLVPSMCVA